MEETMNGEDSLEPPGRPGGNAAGLLPRPAGISAPATAASRHPVELRCIVGGKTRRILSENGKTRAFRLRFFPQATATQWNDWHWQIRNRVTGIEGLERIIVLTADERNALAHGALALPLAITPYYASLIDSRDPEQGLRRTVVPVPRERQVSDGEAADPLGEERDSPLPGLVHRYPDRVLFLVTEFCSTYCRYCTRSRMVGQREHRSMQTAHWERALAYIRATPAVRDVLLSGGDPLTLPDARLDFLLSRLRQIPHVEIVRIGTKVPAVLPHRVTPALVRMLRRHHPLFMSLHFTHPDELTAEAREACNRLADAGIPLGSQTVLLAGINDDAATMKRLMQGLLKARVRPYYLYQCDPILGSAHFRTPVAKGREIVDALRGHTSGYAVPTYVIDAPGGGGKVPVPQETIVARAGGDLLLKNYAGRIYRYPDPVDGPHAAPAGWPLPGGLS